MTISCTFFGNTHSKVLVCFIFHDLSYVFQWSDDPSQLSSAARIAAAILQWTSAAKFKGCFYAMLSTKKMQLSKGKNKRITVGAANEKTEDYEILRRGLIGKMVHNSN